LANVQKKPLIWEKGVESSTTAAASVNVTSEMAPQGGEPIGNASYQTRGLSKKKHLLPLYREKNLLSKLRTLQVLRPTLGFRNVVNYEINSIVKE